MMKRFRIILSVLLFLVSFSISAAVQADELVSDDGTVPIVVTESFGDSGFSHPYKGKGGTSVASLIAEGASTVSEPMENLLALKPVTAEIGIESVLGTDTRMRTFGSDYPARAVVWITFSAGSCSGWLVGKDTVVTAGHCVHSGGSTGSWYPSSSYRVYPGRNGLTSTYGSCTVKGKYSNAGWTVNKYDYRDYGILKLNCTVGNTTGWFGFLYTTASLFNDNTLITGYPGDKSSGTQWTSGDKVRVSQGYRVFYRNDTYGGMSGSPVWSDRYPDAMCSTCYGPYGKAVHAYGVYGTAPYSIYNHGTRIDQSAYNNILYVKNLP